MGFDDEPLAYFITWTVYGMFLQGDSRWWRKRRHGSTVPQPLLEQWHRDRLNHDVLMLTDEQRNVVKCELTKHCVHRGWKLWIANPRTNHVHAVVTAPGYAGRTVRDQLKANCTRGLRGQFSIFVDRPIWTVGGDWQCINNDEDLEQAITYVRDAQD